MSDVLIIGGGAIGLSLAYELAGAGSAVRVIDRFAPGLAAAAQSGAASWSGAGILPPPIPQSSQPLEKLRTLSFELHRQWAEEFRQESGIDNGLRRCGGLYLARTPHDARQLQAEMAAQQSAGVRVDRLDRSDLAALEPALVQSAATQIAYHLPDEVQLRNPRHLKALLTACQQRGVEINGDSEVHDFVVKNERVTELKTSRGTFTAEQICLTGGAWSAGLLEKLGVTIRTKPIRGQIVLFSLPDGKPAFGKVINEGLCYLVPRDDGRVLAGSTEEEAGFIAENTTTAIEDLKKFAIGLVPALADAKVELTWAGLRPGTFDNLPYLGFVPGLKNLFVATGHYRSGLYLSPGTAVVMACLMRGVGSPIDLTPFRLDR